MAHFAELDDNDMVLRVIVVADEHEADGENWCHKLLGGRWKQTSYNTHKGRHTRRKSQMRKNYAGIGYKYDGSRDAFIPPKPYDSWVLNENTCVYESPISYPDDGREYKWNDAVKKWELV
jgi:hypothetical protein